MTDLIRPTDDEARTLARTLLDTARFAALGVLLPDTGAPMVTRIALARDRLGAREVQAAADAQARLVDLEPRDLLRQLLHLAQLGRDFSRKAVLREVEVCQCS